MVIPVILGHASGETVNAELPTISTSCGMASGVKIDMRPPSGGMAKGGGINKRSRDVRRKKNKWSGKIEEKKVMRHKETTEARRVSRARQTPKQNEAVCDANKKRMRKRWNEKKEQR